MSGYAVANPNYATGVAKSVNRGMKDAHYFYDIKNIFICVYQ